MAGPKRTIEQIAFDRQEVAKLMRRGWPKSQIALKLGVHRTQVVYDYKIVMKELAAEQSEETKAYRALKLAEYAEAKKEAWEEWERSKLPLESEFTESYPEFDCPVCEGSGLSSKDASQSCYKCKGKGSLGGEGKTTKKVEGRCGDPNFLRIVLACLEAERELLALNPPKEFHGTTTSTVTQLNWDILANGIPDGPVPDLIEAEILRGISTPLLENLPTDATEVLDGPQEA